MLTFYEGARVPPYRVSMCPWARGALKGRGMVAAGLQVRRPTVRG